MRIKNSTDVATIKAAINIGAGYGHTLINQGEWGSINDEYVWYTLVITNNGTDVVMVTKAGCYGSHSYEVKGSNGSYSIDEVKS